MSDYQNIMGKAHPIPPFSERYERAIHTIQEAIVHGEPEIPKKVLDKAKDKRAFGLEKYGEYSFQSSEQNAMTSPVIDHIEEEIIDLFNYVAHLTYTKMMDGTYASTKYRLLLQDSLSTPLRDLIRGLEIIKRQDILDSKKERL
jgi:hypothetical protein